MIIVLKIVWSELNKFEPNKFGPNLRLTRVADEVVYSRGNMLEVKMGDIIGRQFFMGLLRFCMIFKKMY